MKRILAVAFGFVLSTAAHAADMPAASQPPITHPWHQLSSTSAAATWHGLYFGGQVGGGWGNYDYIFSSGSGTNVGSDLSGVIGGVLAGYNWEVGRFVLGVEGDISGASLSGTSSCVNATYACNASVDWLGTVRGRVGLPINNFLPYVTAGVAFGGMTRTSTRLASSDTLTQSATHTGWVAGGGVDFSLANNWTVGGEVLYVDLGAESYPAATVGAGNFSQVTIGSQFTIARIRALYRFP